ncbi:MAG: hypothetical protein KAX49_11920 [Halanaerobiales bacterium]|nr:hypothetical protein [Halanaerobiales bacterium]
MEITKRKKCEQHVADYRSSGQTAKVWCEANNLNRYTLRYWIQKWIGYNKLDK